MIQDMFPGIDTYYTDRAQHLITGSYVLDYLSDLDDLSDLSDLDDLSALDDLSDLSHLITAS